MLCAPTLRGGNSMELCQRDSKLLGKEPAKKKKKAPEKSGALKSCFAALAFFRSGN
jgi:hypothetical protein